MTVTAPLETDPKTRLGPRCFAVVGSGGLAHELANQLEALCDGCIDRYGQAVKVDRANRPGYCTGTGRETHTLSLADVARYDAIFATDDDPSSVDHLNELCLLAGIRLVVAGTRGTDIVVGVYPFDEADNPACHACCGGVTVDSSSARAGHDHLPTQRIAAGFALTLGLLEASASATPITSRLVGSSTQGNNHAVEVLRSQDCPVCSRVTGPVHVVHTRNRWATPVGVADVGLETLQQVVQLSDAIVTAATCSVCGVLTAQQAGAHMNRRAPDSTTTPPPCPVCRTSGSLRLESQREFTLADLAQRFGAGPAPVRYALVRMPCSTICFDLTDDVKRRPGHWPLVTGAFAAGDADVGAGPTLRPDEG